MSWALSMPPFGAQSTATKKAHGQRGWAHFLEQGLGKTAVIYNEWQSLKPHVDALVVIAPNSLVLNWKREAEKFGITDLVIVWSSKHAARVNGEIKEAMRSFAPVPFIFVINYEASITSGGEAIKEIISKRSVMMVADESIHLKNPNGKRSKALRLMSQGAHTVRILSGAPVSQGVHDLWAQLRFIGAIPTWNFYSFRAHFCEMGGFKGKQVIRPRKDTAPELAKLLGQHSFRAEKKDWTDIPDKLYTTRHEAMSGKHLSAYQSMSEDFLTTLRDNKSASADLVITKLMKLQQIATGFVIDDNNEVHALVEDDANPKLKMLLETLEETDNKVIVFAFHKEAVEILRRNLPPAETTFIVGGATPDELEHQKMLFNSGSHTKVMVCQVNAAMYGHTLLGTDSRPCHTTVFFENVYSLNARVQAEDRNHRHGQKNAVLYVDLTVSKMDQMITSALQTKKDIATTVMENLKNG